MPLLNLSFLVATFLVALGCGGSSGARNDAVAGTCRFASMGDPGSLESREEIINVPSERLSAPQGGLWWIAELLDVPTVVAQSDVSGPIELEVIKRTPIGPDVPLATLRVPPSLPIGARLRLGERELVVDAPTTPLDIDGIGLSHAYRADLGGTGVAVRLPPASRARLFINDAYVGLPYANIQLGIHALEGLLLADASRLCDVSVPADAGEIFVPMWAGRIKPTESLGVLIGDADDFANARAVRLSP